MSDDKWKKIDEDKILNSDTPNTGEMAQYNRIMSRKMRDAVAVTNDRVAALGESLTKTSAIMKNSIEEISNTINSVTKSQSKQQKWMIILSGALTLATIIYAIITGLTLGALKQANQIQAGLLNIQGRQLELDKRPMLYIAIEPRLWTDGKNYYFGGDLTYQNNGAYIARNIDSEYLISNNIADSEVDYKNWYSDTHGSFPDIKAVPPHQNIGPLPLTPSFDKNASWVSIGVLSKYKGYDQEVKYWIKRVDIYNIQKDENGNPIKLVLIRSDLDFDSDIGAAPVSLSIPEWNSFKKN